MSTWDRFIYTTMRLQKRYTVNGRLFLSIGGWSSKYQHLEEMAWNRYIMNK
jgi:hypothetical protein